jgi:hypothetical protein
MDVFLGLKPQAESLSLFGTKAKSLRTFTPAARNRHSY